jgi:hypothetical protein
VISAVLRTTSLDVLDLLITLAVSTANAPVPGNPRAAGGAVPRSRGIRRNAISRMLNVPLETVRRRVSILLKKKIIYERDGGLIVPDGAPLGMLNNTSELLAFNAQTVRQLFVNLKAQGVRLD